MGHGHRQLAAALSPVRRRSTRLLTQRLRWGTGPGLGDPGRAITPEELAEMAPRYETLLQSDPPAYRMTEIRCPDCAGGWIARS